MSIKDLKNYKGVNILMTHAQHAALKKMSKETDAPVVALVRRAIDEFLAKRKK